MLKMKTKEVIYQNFSYKLPTSACSVECEGKKYWGGGGGGGVGRAGLR